MFRRFTLQPATVHDAPLDFEWNPATGELHGKSAELVAGLCRQAVREGWVTGHPHPTEYAITDPFRRVDEMAVVLGQYWQLDDYLGSAYPTKATTEAPSPLDDLLLY